MKSLRTLVVLGTVLALAPLATHAQISPVTLDLELFGPWAFCSTEFNGSLTCTIRLGQTLQVWVQSRGAPPWMPIKLIASWLPDNASFESIWRQGEAAQVFTFTPDESHVTKPTEPLIVRFIARTDFDSISRELKVHVWPNRPPQAVTNPDQTVAPNQIVLLSAFESSDPDGEVLRYRWNQIAGPPVPLFGEETLYAIFLAPSEPGTLVFRLTVSDGAFSVSKDVTVTVNAGASASLRRLWESSMGYPNNDFGFAPVPRRIHR